MKLPNEDWIRVRTALVHDPRVILMAEILTEQIVDPTEESADVLHGVIRHNLSLLCNAVIGALVSVWGFLRHRGARDGDDLTLPGANLLAVDDLARLPGFGEAMARAGWVIQTQKSLVFPQFFEKWNFDPARERVRAQNAERQRRHRERYRNVADNPRYTLRNAPVRERVREDKTPQKRTKKPPAAASHFTPPTAAEVEAYCRERGNGIDPARWLAYYESNGWRVGRNPMRDWKAAVRTWERQKGEFAARRNGPDPAAEQAAASARRERERRERAERDDWPEPMTAGEAQKFTERLRGGEAK